MKVMVLVPSFVMTSPIESAFLLTEYLMKQGVDVTFVSLDDSYLATQNILKKISTTGLKHTCLNIKGWLGILFHHSRIQNYIKHNRIDIVFTYGLRPTLLHFFTSNVIKMISIRGMYREAYYRQYPYGKFIYNMFISIFMKQVRMMDHVFSMSQAMFQWLVSEGIEPNKISIVNNFVDVELINQFCQDDEEHERTTINIGMFCDFHLRKRVDIAIKAFKKLVQNNQHRQLFLHLAGKGPLLSKMKDLTFDLNLSDKVIFHGFLTDPFPIMRKMKLILLTSESEGISRSIMEAMSLGKTCVVSDTKGIDDLVKDGETGYTFPIGDVDKLVALLHNIINNDAYLEPNKIIEYIRENHDVNIEGSKILNIMTKCFVDYRKAINHHRPEAFFKDKVA